MCRRAARGLTLQVTTGPEGCARMTWLGSTLVARSSDAIAVIRLRDRAIADVNEAFSRLTGFGQAELLGRDASELFVNVGAANLAATLHALRGDEVVDAHPAGFRTRSRDLRVGRLSALVLEVDGQDHAVCTLRGTRDPLSWERCMAARMELVRLLEGGASPGVTARALRALGEHLEWELSAFWRPEPGRGSLGCAALWRAPSVRWAWPKECGRDATFPHGAGVVWSVWLSGRPAWAPDVSRERGGLGVPEDGSDPVRGCFAFPVVAEDRVLGVVQLVSRRSREPESDLLAMSDDLGRLLGWLARDRRNQAERPLDGSGPGPQRTPEPRHLLRELIEVVSRLGSLVGGMVDPVQGDQSAQAPTGPAPSPARKGQPPVGVTLKTVSERTGVPAATLRTWERRYGVPRPRRSSNGYRLYLEDDITRIFEVTDLLRRGVQLRDAMAAVGEPVAEPASNGNGAPSSTDHRPREPAR